MILSKTFEMIDPHKHVTITDVTTGINNGLIVLTLIVWIEVAQVLNSQLPSSWRVRCSLLPHALYTSLYNLLYGR